MFKVYFLISSCKIEETIVIFFILLGMKGPEGDMSKDGQYDLMLLSSSAELNNVKSNDMNTRKLCSKYA
jgi:hypothetical protein